MSDRTLSDFLDLDYEATCHRKGGRFYLHLPDLRLIGEGETVQAAYDDLERQKRALFEKYSAMGRADAIPLPAESAGGTGGLAAMKPFLLKTALVALVGVLLIVAANVSITYTLTETPKYVGQVAARYALRKFVSGVDRIARREITPEQEARFRKTLRRAVPRLKPYVAELAPLFGCPAPPGAAKPT